MWWFFGLDGKGRAAREGPGNALGTECFKVYCVGNAMQDKLFWHMRKSGPARQQAGGRGEVSRRNSPAGRMMRPPSHSSRCGLTPPGLVRGRVFP